MGNIATAAIAAPGQLTSDIQALFVIGSDPAQITAELVEKLTAAALETVPLALNDVSIGGAGQGQKFCVTATLVPNPGGEPYTFVLYMASSPDELGKAFDQALAQAIENAGVVPYDFLGHTVVGSSDGSRFLGMLLARAQGA